jgi:hypothetical protein
MGADNWAVCPRCFTEAEKEAKRLLQEALESYGKVGIEEFDALRAAVPCPERAGFMTLREDYGFVNNNAGEVEVEYRASCVKCGLSHKFETVLDLVGAG